MLNKYKPKKLLLLFFSTIVLFLNSCQKEEIEDSKNNVKIKEYSFKELNQIPKFNYSYNLYRNKLNKLRTTKRSISEIVIDSSTVKVIESNDATTYTMAIVSENTSYYENLIIQQTTSDSISAFIATYPITSEIVYLPEHNSYSYNSTPTFEQLNLDDNSQNRMHLVCYDVYLCDWGTIHPATDDCNHVYVEQSCFNMGGDGGGSIGDSEPSVGHSNDDGGGGGGNSTGNTGSNSPTQEVINPPIKTSPVVPTEENQVEVTNAKNCEKLNKLSASKNNLGQPITNQVRNALIKNTQDVTASNVEQGFRLFMDPTTGSLTASPVTNPNTQDCGALPIKTISGMMGYFHSHTAGCSEHGLHEMFSHMDILKFYEVILNHNAANIYSTPVDPSNFVVTVATESGTYALKITDLEAFKSIMNILNTNQDAMDNFLHTYSNAQNKNTFNSLGTPIGNSGTTEKNMLNMIKDLLGGSVSLHKAKNDFSGWNRLELVNGVVTLKSCN